MNGRFMEELNRFEAEIGQPQPHSQNRMFLPPQMRHTTPGPGMPGMGMNRFPPRAPMMMSGPRPNIGPRPVQAVIAAPPSVNRPPAATISAPPQTITSSSKATDDDDILATLQKYEAEVKSDKSTKKGEHSQGSSSIHDTYHRKSTQMAESTKKSVVTSVVRAPSTAPTAPAGMRDAPSSATISDQSLKKAKKQKRIIRTGGGQVWEDETLKDWDPNDFRIFCGDLGNDVTDEVLARTFGRYPSFQRAKVIRDKKTNKTRGYGFVSFKDPADFTRAMKELNGKYVGSRPVKLRKSNWKDRNVDIVRQKQKLKQKMGYKW